MLNMHVDIVVQFFWPVGHLQVYCFFLISSDQLMFLDCVAPILHLKSVEKVALCSFFNQLGKDSGLYVHQML